MTGFHLAAIKGHADVVQVYLKQVGLDCALSDPYLTPCCAVRGQMSLQSLENARPPPYTMYAQIDALQRGCWL